MGACMATPALTTANAASPVVAMWRIYMVFSFFSIQKKGVAQSGRTP